MTFAVAANEKGEKVLTMSKEYIEREKAIEWFMAFVHMGESDIPAETVITDLKYAIPAADVVEVLHGQWRFGKDLPDSFGSINKNKYHLYCSECRNQAFNNTTDNDCDFDMDTPFCPWCGAKMDGEGV